MPVVTCPVCGREWFVHSHIPGGEGRCLDCRAAGRRPTAEWAFIAAAALAFLVLATVLWRMLC
jgi:hypothetical protein